MDEDAFVIAKIAEFVRLDFVFLGFVVIHIAFAGAVTPRAFYNPLFADKIGGLNCISLVTIRGFGSSNDANHLTGPSRDGAGLARAIQAALQSAKFSQAEIDYVHAHGTGTSYNDAMESLALKTIFGEACPPVSGSKGMLGHTLGAAGVIETICCVLAMQNNFLPGTPQLNVAAEGTPKNLLHEPRSGVALKNVLKLNTGFGGMNGALLLGHE